MLSSLKQTLPVLYVVLTKPSLLLFSESSLF